MLPLYVLSRLCRSVSGTSSQKHHGCNFVGPSAKFPCWKSGKGKEIAWPDFYHSSMWSQPFPLNNPSWKQWLRVAINRVIEGCRQKWKEVIAENTIIQGSLICNMVEATENNFSDIIPIKLAFQCYLNLNWLYLFFLYMQQKVFKV